MTYTIDQNTIIVKEKLSSSSVNFLLVTGRIINKSDKKQVENASVFLSNATIGGKTGADGSFRLENIRPGNYDLVVSMVGFETYHQAISLGNTAVGLPDIEIVPKTISLNEVVIRPRNAAEQKKYYEIFEKAFLGTSSLADKCRILNPEIIDFVYDKKTSTLSASSNDFILIRNNALGYDIKYLLSDFELDSTGRMVRYNGAVLLEQMQGTASRARKWDKNRAEVYATSEMHFLRSLLDDQVEDEGFRVLKYNWVKSQKGLMKTLVHTPLKRNDILNKTDKEGLYALGTNQNDLYIEYNKKHRFRENDKPPFLNDPFNYETSVISFYDPYLFFDINGWVSNPTSIGFSGAWGKYRVAGILPSDYDPLQTKVDENVVAIPVSDTSNIGKQLLSLKNASDTLISKYPQRKYTCNLTSLIMPQMIRFFKSMAAQRVYLFAVRSEQVASCRCCK